MVGYLQTRGCAAQSPCSHPKAKVWFYRDDDTYMRCEDCGRRWCGSPAHSDGRGSTERCEPVAWRIEWIDGALSFSVRKPWHDSITIKTITPLYALTLAHHSS